MLPVAILAGGLATRLKPITETIPKALVDVAGKPFLVHQLELLRRNGVRRVVLCIAHLAEMIEAVVGDGRSFGVDVVYSHDGDKLIGTGGALRTALPLLGERFLVLYGDSYLTCDYADVATSFMSSGKLGLMTVYRNDGRYDASNVSVDDSQIVRYDKTPGIAGMTHIDYGLGGLHADALAGYPIHERLDLAVVYQDLLARRELVAYEAKERFYEIGSPSGLEDTRRFIQSQENA